MDYNELKEFLDEKVNQYQHPNFIQSDPIQIPKNFSCKEDIEIAFKFPKIFLAKRILK